VELDGIKSLRLVSSLDDFYAGVGVQKVGELAEEEGYPTALLTEWGGTMATWRTHKIRGLHRTDFI